MARSSSSDRASRFAAIRAASTFAGLDRGGLGIFLVRFVDDSPKEIGSQQAWSVSRIVWIRIAPKDRQETRIRTSRAMMTVHAVADDAAWKPCFQPRIKGYVGPAIRFKRQVEIIACAHQIIAPHALDGIRPAGSEGTCVRAIMPPERGPYPVVDFLGRQMGSGEHDKITLLQRPVWTKNPLYKLLEPNVRHCIRHRLCVQDDGVKFVEPHDMRVGSRRAKEIDCHGFVGWNVGACRIDGDNSSPTRIRIARCV